MGQSNIKRVLQRLVRESLLGEPSDEVVELFRQTLGGELSDETLKATEAQHGAHLTQDEARHMGVSLAEAAQATVSRVELHQAVTTGTVHAVPVAWDVKHAALFLGVSEKTLYRLAAEGSVPSFKVGGARCFDPDALAVWRTAQQKGGR